MKHCLPMLAIFFSIASCKRAAESELYIYGGDAVTKNDPLFTTNVAIGKVTTEHKKFEMYCSGVVISPHTILTSAACFDTNESQIFIRADGASEPIRVDAMALQNSSGTTAPKLSLLSIIKPLPANLQSAQFYNGSFDNPQAWIYALGQNDNGDFGELRRFAIRIEQSHDGVILTNGSLATGDSGGGLFVGSAHDEVKLAGILSDAGNAETPRTTFTNIQTQTEWIQCASEHTRAFYDNDYFADENCPMVDIYGL